MDVQPISLSISGRTVYRRVRYTEQSRSYEPVSEGCDEGARVRPEAGDAASLAVRHHQQRAVLRHGQRVRD